jgi:hypothetical protein
VRKLLGTPGPALTFRPSQTIDNLDATLYTGGRRRTRDVAVLKEAGRRIFTRARKINSKSPSIYSRAGGRTGRKETAVPLFAPSFDFLGEYVVAFLRTVQTVAHLLESNESIPYDRDHGASQKQRSCTSLPAAERRFYGPSSRTRFMHPSCSLADAGHAAQSF